MINLTKLPPIILGICLLQSLSIAQSPQPNTDKSNTDKPTDQLKQQQSQLATQYANLEEVFLRMSEIEAATNPTRAGLLMQAAQMSKQLATQQRMLQAGDLLGKGQFSRAIPEMEASKENLKKLLELLQSENRSSRIKDERKMLEEVLKDIRRIENIQRATRGRTESGQDTQSAANDQKDLEQQLQTAEKDLADKKEKSNTPNDSSANKDTNKNDKNSDANQSNPKNEQPKNESGKQGTEQKEPNSSEKSDQQMKDPQENNKPNDKDPNNSQEKNTDRKNTDQDKNDPNKSEQNSEPNKSDSQKSDSQKSDPKKSNSEQSDTEQPNTEQPNTEQSESEQSESEQSENADRKPKSKQEQARDRVQKARQRMQKAEKNLRENKRKDAVEEQEKAEEELQQAIAELEKILKQLREEEIERTLVDLETRLKRMAEWERTIREQSEKLGNLAGEERDRQLDIQANKLATEQLKVAMEGQRAMLLLKDEGSSQAFPEALQQVINDAQLVVKRLNAADLSVNTLAIEDEIIGALDEMLESLQEVQKKREEEKQNRREDGSGGGGGSPPEEPLVGAIAELRLIKTLQLRVNRRTDRLADQSNNKDDLIGEVSDQKLREELLELSGRQQKIQGVTRDILLEASKK